MIELSVSKITKQSQAEKYTVLVLKALFQKDMIRRILQSAWIYTESKAELQHRH